MALRPLKLIKNIASKFKITHKMGSDPNGTKLRRKKHFFFPVDCGDNR